MLPNFLHIGASKSASSWLWRVCIEHPQIYVPNPPDNVNFFTVAYQRGIDWYESTYFGEWAGEPAVGEFSNSYLAFEPAQARLARHLPDVRLTMILRHPVERALLSWGHVHLKKSYGFDPDQSVGIPLDRLVHHHGHTWFRAFLGPSFYACALRSLIQRFGRERLLITLYDDLVADNTAFTRRYFEFLGVDAGFRPQRLGEIVNADRPGLARHLPPGLVAELCAAFRDEIDDLQQLLGRDLSHWLEPPVFEPLTSAPAS